MPKTEVFIIKKIISLIMVILCVLSVSVCAAPASVEGFTIPVDVTINDIFIKASSKPVIENNLIYMPLRSFADAISADVTWNAETRAATLSKYGMDFTFYADKNFCTFRDVDDPYGAAIMYGDTMFIPLDFVCYWLGYGFSWNSYYYIYEIIAPDIVVPETSIDTSYTKEDLYWLSKITHVECGAESVRTRIGIANTVINRVRSPIYPNNIYDAILDVKHGVQYPPAHTAKFRNCIPSNTSMIAAKCALNGVELVGTSVAFVHVNAFERSWAANNMRHYTTIGVVGFFTFD